MLCLGMYSNVMHRFMVQAFHDPPLCCSTFENVDNTYTKEYAEINSIKFTTWLTIFAKDKDQTKPIIETG